MNTATIDFMAGLRGVGFRTRHAIGRAYDAGFSDGAASVMEDAVDKRNGDRMIEIKLEEEVVEFVKNLIGDRGMNFQISETRLMEKARRGFYFAQLMDWPPEGEDLQLGHSRLFRNLLKQGIEGRQFRVNRKRWGVRVLRKMQGLNLWFEVTR